MTPEANSRAQRLRPIERAADAFATPVQHMSVNHRRAHVLVAEQLLYSADIVTRLKEMGGKGMAQGVAACGLGDPGLSGGRLDRALQALLIDVMTPFGA